MNASTVRDAMTASPTTVEAHETAVDAARLMAAQNVGSLPVVEGEDLVGMVTDRDLVLNVLAKDVDPHKATVASICSENPIVVGPEDSLDIALQHMAREQIRRLPVVEERRLIGILAQADVSRTVEPAATGRMVEEISSDERRGLGELSSVGGRVRRRDGFGTRHEDGEPRGVVPAHRLDAIRQAREHELEAVIGLGVVVQRADRHRDVPVLRVDLHRCVVVARRIQHAQHGELEIIHALVRQIETRAEPAEHETRDTAIGGVGRDGEHDGVVHVVVRLLGRTATAHDRLDS